MNRTSKCIKMLMLLSQKEYVKKEELSKELETNVRNIREYRKELEEAGILIDVKKGRYGGYHLENCFLSIH